MNSSGGGLHGKWRRIFVSALLVVFSLAGNSISTPASAAPLRKPASQKGAQAQQADVLPSDDAVGAGGLDADTHPAAPDLLLKKEDAAKGEALAAFAAGLMAEGDADPEEALNDYQKALSLDPANTELALKVAYELARRGDVTAGIETLKDTIKAAPKEPVPYLYLSQLYAKYLKKPELGLKYAQQALDLDPSNSAAYLAVYELYAATGQQKKADQILDRATSLQLDDPQFWAQLGEIYTRLFLKEDGSATPENLKRMNAVFQKALAHANDDPDVITRVADFYMNSRQVKEAIPLYLKVIGMKQEDDDSSISDASLANLRDKLAKSFRRNGQNDEAIAVLQQLIKENPMRSETYELLAEMFVEKENLEGALGAYQQVLMLDPSRPINHLRVADIQLRLKNFDKAIQTLTDARAKFPDVPQITYSLALTFGQAKQNQKSVATFEEALHEAENTQPEMLDGRFYFAYGAAAEQAGLIEKATELLKKSIELDPSNAAEAYNYLGYMWADRGENLDEAGDLIKRALDLEPDNAAYLDSLGWWLYKKGEPQKALEQLQKAAEAIKPEDAVVYEHLGDTYAKLNNVSQALIYWQKAVALEPDDKTAIVDKIENAKQKLAHQTVPGTAPQN